MEETSQNQTPIIINNVDENNNHAIPNNNPLPTTVPTNNYAPTRNIGVAPPINVPLPHGWEERVRELQNTLEKNNSN